MKAIKNKTIRLETLAHTFNFSYLGSKDRQIAL
jgi:hypothetical protein